ncbi:hypothetical protein Mal4_04750 [Maioricimonas rarisocia]|uniref:Uncharacterized protein n=1 Tax=Maioricimonas rarisocia TaxID=2528026 RepID=A0A517Z141_9PLAN|nr:hypothetical protein Mal4_04750 [Maioricimonas rarisocia]
MSAVGLERSSRRAESPQCGRCREHWRGSREPRLSADKVPVVGVRATVTLRERRCFRRFVCRRSGSFGPTAAGRRGNRLFGATAAARCVDLRPATAESLPDQRRRTPTAARDGVVDSLGALGQDPEREPQQRDKIADQQREPCQPAETGRHSSSTAPLPHDSCLDRSPDWWCSAIIEPTGKLPAPSTTWQS